MAFAGINYLAVLIAAVVGLAFGAAHYMTLSRPRPAAVGKTKVELAAAGKGFVITTLAVNYAFSQRRPMLSVIDGMHWLGVLVMQGAIIGAMGV